MVAGGATLGRALDILEVLGGDEAAAAGGLRVVRIADLLGREKSQVSRALKTLSGRGFVDRDPETRVYRLGWRLYGLASRTSGGRLLALAPPILRRLVAALGETAHLSVLEGDQVLTLLSERSPRQVQASDWTGRRVPAHCTSSGRALLVDEDRASLAAVLNVRDAELTTLERRMARVREPAGAGGRGGRPGRPGAVEAIGPTKRRRTT